MCGFACNFGSVKAQGRQPRWRGGAMTRLIKPKVYVSAHCQGDALSCWQIAPTTAAHIETLRHTHTNTLRAWTRPAPGICGWAFSPGSRRNLEKQPNFVRSHITRKSAADAQKSRLPVCFCLIQNLRISSICDLKLWTIKSPQGKYDSWLGPLKERLSVYAIGVC